MRSLLAGTALLLAGCMTPTGSGTEPPREVANEVVTEVLTRRLPAGSPVRPIAGCVVENATTEELFRLVASQLAGVTPETTQLVLGILQRPETINCVVTKGLSITL